MHSTAPVADLPLLVVQLSFVSLFSVMLCNTERFLCCQSIANICNKYFRAFQWKCGGEGGSKIFLDYQCGGRELLMNRIASEGTCLSY